MSQKASGKQESLLIQQGVSDGAGVAPETAPGTLPESLPGEPQEKPRRLQEIGDLLRSKREELQLSLADAQAATKIRRRYLEALEAGNDTIAPGEVYFRGFLRLYADYLGLDGLALVQEYRAMKDAMAEGRERTTGSQVEPAAGGASSGPIGPAPRARGGSPAPPGAPRMEPRARARAVSIALFVLCILVVVAGVRMLAPGVSPRPAEPPAQASQPESPGGAAPPGPAAPTEVPGQPGPDGQPGSSASQGLPPPAPGGEQSIAPPPVTREDKSRYVTVISVKADSLSLAVSAKDGPCWVKVESDGKPVAEGILEAGARRTWEAKERLLIRVGAPWVLNLTLNGVDLGVAGPKDSPPKDLDITRAR